MRDLDGVTADAGVGDLAGLREEKTPIGDWRSREALKMWLTGALDFQTLFDGDGLIGR